MRYHNKKWTIICCSVPRQDPIRAWKFFDACNILEVTPRLIPAAESSPDQDLGKLELLDLEPFDTIVTHNSRGEYGHRHHRNVHEYITKRYANKQIFTFGYSPGRLGEVEIKLSEFESHRKMAALKQYNHIHPYQGKNIPKWEALLHRYRDIEGIDFNTETFDEYST